MLFSNREDAGRQLAYKLGDYAEDDSVVYALPRGGIIPAGVVSSRLRAPLDLLIPRKIGHPSNPEFGVCAVTDDGHLVCNEGQTRYIEEGWLQKEIELQMQESRRRRDIYLKGRSPLPFKNKTAIIVDNGIATGLTMLAAIKQVRDRHPAKIVVAVPVMSSDVADTLGKYVDDIVALDIPAFYMGSVGAYYEKFDQVDDGEVTRFMALFSNIEDITNVQ